MCNLPEALSKRGQTVPGSSSVLFFSQRINSQRKAIANCQMRCRLVRIHQLFFKKKSTAFSAFFHPPLELLIIPGIIGFQGGVNISKMAGQICNERSIPFTLPCNIDARTKGAGFASEYSSYHLANLKEPLFLGSFGLEYPWQLDARIGWLQ